MRGSSIRALGVAGLLAFAASGAHAANAVQHPATKPLDLMSYNTIADGNSQAFTTDQFDLGLPVDMPQLSLGPQAPLPLAPGDAFGRVNLGDDLSLEFGAGTGLADRLEFGGDGGWSGYGLLSSRSALADAYLNGGASYAGVRYAPFDRLRFTLGAASLLSGYELYPTSPQAALARLGGQQLPLAPSSGNTLLAGMGYDFASWGTVGVTASQTSQTGNLLGVANALTPGSETSALGVGARVQLGGGWMTSASFAEAVTKLDLKSALVAPLDGVHTRTYGLSVAKRGVFGNDAMGFTVTRPAPAELDGSDLALVSGVGASSRFLNESRLLEGKVPETDFELGYVTTFLGGSVALQTNAAYQMNFAGQTGNNAVSLLSRAKIKF